jgi:hypothetical protein
MTKTKFSQRRENTAPVRRASWGKLQLRSNTSDNAYPEHLDGMPMLEEFGAFFSSLRGVPTVVTQIHQATMPDLQPILGLRFCDAAANLGCIVWADLIAVAALGGGIRRFRSSDIRFKIETRTIDDEMLKAWRYVGHRLADMVSSTQGPRLYFQDITDPKQTPSASMRTLFEKADFRMRFNLDLQPFGEGHLGVALGL